MMHVCTDSFFIKNDLLDINDEIINYTSPFKAVFICYTFDFIANKTIIFNLLTW